MQSQSVVLLHIFLFQDANVSLIRQLRQEIERLKQMLESARAVWHLTDLALRCWTSVVISAEIGLLGKVSVACEALGRL